jgi:hypothetical protein
MRFCLAVPTYWTYPGGPQEEEVIYDHPTPLDTDGTLERFLTSARKFTDAGTQIVVVAAAAAEPLQAAVERRVHDLITRLPQSPPPLLFSYSHLKRLHAFCRQHGHEDFIGLLSLSGYAAIRNLTLVLANLLDAEVMVSLDDDEIIADPNFLAKITSDFAILGKDYEMFGLAGLYENPQGEILATEPTGEWVMFWPKIRWMNEAFSELAATDSNLNLTPLALGGNMAMGAKLYRFLPFDPAVSRGEDIDYVINARMFQVPFFLDHNLRVVHDPPAKSHPLWQRLRQDLQRFWYTRHKLLAQESSGQLALVTLTELMPYPGNFLTDDLEIRAYRAHTTLALEYLASGQWQEARQTLLNLAVLRDWPSTKNVFRTYLDKVGHWRRLQSWLNLPQVRETAKESLWG